MVWYRSSWPVRLLGLAVLCVSAGRVSAQLTRKPTPRIVVTKPRDCSESTPETTGVQDIFLSDGSQGPKQNGSDQPLRQVKAFCELDNGTSYLVVLRRADIKPRENFIRDWDDYKDGFGNLTGEFWWGLENLHQITRDRRYELRVDMEAFDNSTAYAVYQDFQISAEADGYMLSVSQYKGTAGDGLSYNHNRNFTVGRTPGVCFDKHIEDAGSAWWYAADCNPANLNGQYLENGDIWRTGIHWWTWRLESLKKAEMKIRLSQGYITR